MNVNKLILYVEDDSEMKAPIMDILATEGFEVIMDSGKNLEELLKKNEVGLIFMDENLKWCQGSDLCRQLKSIPAYQKIPVIMISGLWDIPAIAHDCGANGYIRKPFDMYDIVSAVSLYYPKHNGN